MTVSEIDTYLKSRLKDIDWYVSDVERDTLSIEVYGSPNWGADSEIEYLKQEALIDNFKRLGKDWKEELMYSFDYKAGLATIQAKNVEKSYQTIKETLINRVEALFELISTPYVKVAQFSNGEAIYQKS